MKNNKNVTVKNSVMLSLTQHLQRLPLSLLNDVRGRFQIKFGMTPLFNNGGFTLIEFLVVVLIIGILAAVAVPQYQKAVIKAQGVEAIVKLTALINAKQISRLESGSYGANNKFYDIIPTGQWASSWAGTSSNMPNSYVYSCHGVDGCIANADNPSMPMFQKVYLDRNAGNPQMTKGTLWCTAYKKNKTADSICKAMSNYTLPGGQGNYYRIN